MRVSNQPDLLWPVLIQSSQGFILPFFPLCFNLRCFFPSSWCPCFHTLVLNDTNESQKRKNLVNLQWFYHPCFTDRKVRDRNIGCLTKSILRTGSGHRPRLQNHLSCLSIQHITHTMCFFFTVLATSFLLLPPVEILSFITPLLLNVLIYFLIFCYRPHFHRSLLVPQNIPLAGFSGLCQSFAHPRKALHLESMKGSKNLIDNYRLISNYRDGFKIQLILRAWDLICKMRWKK